MKSLTIRFALVAMLFFGISATTTAQQMPALPIDPQVRYGKLDNGLTYYIRHNEEPKQRAEFYIAQKVGSVLEEDNQRGLAHFLEHMAFNGTKNFPGKSMLTYLESIGAKFGANINAYTGFDETVYTLMNIPVTREGIVDTCLLVLHDWSSEIALEDKEIDAERGVIREEWRTGQDATMRMWDILVPGMFAGSQYANRMPIGKMEVIDNFKYQTLRDYYHKWYRPDQQAIIVVGDINVDEVEAKIKNLFGKIEMPNPAATRVYFEVPDNKEPLVVIGKDKEATNARITIYYKHDPLPAEIKSTAAGLVMYYANSVIENMLNARLEELAQKANAPFVAAGTFDGPILGITKTKDAFATIAISSEKEINKAMTALVQETARVDQHGFTASEYERAKADFLKSIENLYNERSKQKNSTYVKEYVSHFTDGGSISGIENEYALFNQIVPSIPLEAINEIAKKFISNENIIITIQGSDKEDITYPTEAELVNILNTVSKEQVAAYEDTVSDEPLIKELPTAGKVVSTETDKTFGTTIWTLSNGAKVVLKPTDFKDDQILLNASSVGGSSLIGKKYDKSIQFIGDVIGVGGVGNFSATDLPKVLAGKKVMVNAAIDELTEVVRANASPKDLETMMQLVYLQFTSLRKDDEAFVSWKNRMGTMLENAAANPVFIYNDSLLNTIYNYNPRMGMPTKADIENLNYDDILALYKERFNDASDFTFVFVGNIDESKLKPLVEQYIASLPSTGSKEQNGAPLKVRPGKVNNIFEKSMESPKTTVNIIVSGEVEGNLKNSTLLDMIWQILRSRYTETMREEEGGTYGARVQMDLDSRKKEGSISISFDTNAEQYPKLQKIAFAEFEKLANEGPSDADFQKVKEYMLKKHGEDIRENGYWMSRLSSYYLNNVDYISNYNDLVGKLTKDDVKKMAKALLSQGNAIEVTMNGVKK